MIKMKSRIKVLAQDVLRYFPQRVFDAKVNWMMVQEPKASKKDCRRILKQVVKIQGGN